jgi:DHA1 family multidrug resistance protein-like MFS transporter
MAVEPLTLGEAPPVGALPASTAAATYSIALGAGIASFSMNFWWPLLPLYVMELGATSDANALFWVAFATTIQGFARLASGPFWGILSDRYGRKLMFVRALYAASFTTVIAAVATEPWHIAVALTMQGLFSGFIPAAVALTSVTVPDQRLRNSLGIVTGAQYLGTTAGPAVGSLLAIMLGFRGAIWAAAILPSLAATLVLVMVPRDNVGRQIPRAGGDPGRAGGRTFLRGFTSQFYLAVFLYFVMFATNQLVRLATPIALREFGGKENAKAAAGIAFTIAGAAAVFGALVVARAMGRRVPLRWSLGVLCLVAAAGHLALAGANSVVMYLAAFGVISLVQGTMLPASNTLIAATVEPSRRGTAFGIASSAQAVAFMIGPMGAAFFAAHSLHLGFTVVAGCLVLLGGLLFVALREEEGPAGS